MIPTYNRPDYLRRTINYYNEGPGCYGVIVADSSSADNKKANKEFISSISNRSILHISYPQEINPFCKFDDALKRVNVKYCVICADDDFITPNGIDRSVDFLESNPDFSVAHGRYISFRLEKRRNGQYFRWQPTYSALSIACERPEQRLIYHLSNYCTPTFYAVHRTAVLRLITRETLEAKLDALPFFELLASMLALICGKMKHLDVFYGARDAGLVRSVRWPSLADLATAGTYDVDSGRFRDCLATHLSGNSQLDLADSKKVVDQAMSAYMEKYYYRPKWGTGYISAKVGRVLGRLGLPDWLDRAIRRSYERFVESRHTVEASMDISPSSEYYDDFDRIRRHVLDSSGIVAK